MTADSFPIDWFRHYDLTIGPLHSTIGQLNKSKQSFVCFYFRCNLFPTYPRRHDTRLYHHLPAFYIVELNNGPCLHTATTCIIFRRRECTYSRTFQWFGYFSTLNYHVTDTYIWTTISVKGHSTSNVNVSNSVNSCAIKQGRARKTGMFRIQMYSI